MVSSAGFQVETVNYLENRSFLYKYTAPRQSTGISRE
jgi:hypothetical protein